MSKDARNEDLDLRPEAREKFYELVALLATHGFGEQGPPRDTDRCSDSSAQVWCIVSHYAVVNESNVRAVWATAGFMLDLER